MQFFPSWVFSIPEVFISLTLNRVHRWSGDMHLENKDCKLRSGNINDRSMNLWLLKLLLTHVFSCILLVCYYTCNKMSTEIEVGQIWCEADACYRMYESFSFINKRGHKLAICPPFIFLKTKSAFSSVFTAYSLTLYISIKARLEHLKNILLWLN